MVTESAAGVADRATVGGTDVDLGDGDSDGGGDETAVGAGVAAGTRVGGAAVGPQDTIMRAPTSNDASSALVMFANLFPPLCWVYTASNARDTQMVPAE